MINNPQILGSSGQPLLPVRQSAPKMSGKRLARACLGALMAAWLMGLSACGQKGPLYLPAPASSPTSPALTK
jgi:predicted small lipoprotein YifL